MQITMEWLEDNLACFEGCEWFLENFPEGAADRDEVLKKLEEANELDHYSWLLWKTLYQCPLPRGWVLPEGLKELNLGGGTLPAGTVLPEGLKWLDLDGGTLPRGTVLPAGLKELKPSGGTLPDGTVLPEGLQVLRLGGGTLLEGLEIPAGCRVYY